MIDVKNIETFYVLFFLFSHQAFEILGVLIAHINQYATFLLDILDLYLDFIKKKFLNRHVLFYFILRTQLQAVSFTLPFCNKEAKTQRNKLPSVNSL